MSQNDFKSPSSRRLIPMMVSPSVPKGKVQSMQTIVSEHEQYLDAVRDFNDWLISAKEELQRWSDLSGDSVSIKRKLSKVQVRNVGFLYLKCNIR